MRIGPHMMVGLLLLVAILLLRETDDTTWFVLTVVLGIFIGKTSAAADRYS